MNCIVLSLKNLEKESLALAQKVEVDFRPDLVVYIARGGYLIGETIAGYFKVDNIGIHAERNGSKLKEFISPILVCLPQGIKLYLRKMELASGVHKEYKERKLYWDNSDQCLRILNDKKNILVVDDSVDTGYSMINVVQEIYRIVGKNVVIKTAAINCWSKSFPIIKTDFFSYEDTIIQTPMSKDSKEYSTFEILYANRKTIR